MLCQRLLLRARISARFPISLHSQRALPTRHYATKKIDGATLIPRSQQPIQDPAAQEEYVKAETKMKEVVEWYRKECANVETRATGRVTPSILAPVRVTLPHDSHEYKLEELATVGIKDGSLLLVTLYDESVRLLSASTFILPETSSGRTSSTLRKEYTLPSCQILSRRSTMLEQSEYQFPSLFLPNDTP